MTNTVKRKLYYYTVHTASGTPFYDILKYIYDTLTGDAIYTPKSADEDYFIGTLTKDTVSGFIQGTIVNGRKNAKPSKSTIGTRNIQSIGLSSNECIAEITHFIFSPNNNILCIEYNHFGPRLSALEFHINERVSQNARWTINEVSFQPLVNFDSISQIDDIGEIKLVEVTLPRSIQSRSPENDTDFFQSLKQAFSHGNTGRVTLIMRPDKGSREPIFDDPNFVKNELEALGYDISSFDDFKIKALSNSTGKTKIFDLMQSQFKQEVTPVKMEASKDISSEDIFAKMKAIYLSKHQEILELARNNYA